MSKRILLVYFILCFCLLNQISSGQEESGMRIHASMGFSSMSEEAFGFGLWSGFGFSVPFYKNIHLSFNFGSWRSPVSAKPDELQEGDLTVNPFFVLMHYYLASNRTFYPYFFLGGGYVFSSFRMDDIYTIPEISLSQKVGNSLGGQVGAGLQLNVSRRVSFVLDVSYLFSKATATTTIQDLNFGTTTDEFSVRLGAILVQLGIKFFI